MHGIAVVRHKDRIPQRLGMRLVNQARWLRKPGSDSGFPESAPGGSDLALGSSQRSPTVKAGEQTSARRLPPATALGRGDLDRRPDPGQPSAASNSTSIRAWGPPCFANAFMM